jgi:hypothetical protein
LITFFGSFYEIIFFAGTTHLRLPYFSIPDSECHFSFITNIKYRKKITPSRASFPDSGAETDPVSKREKIRIDRREFRSASDQKHFARGSQAHLSGAMLRPTNKTTTLLGYFEIYLTSLAAPIF